MVTLESGKYVLVEGQAFGVANIDNPYIQNPAIME